MNLKLISLLRGAIIYRVYRRKKTNKLVALWTPTNEELWNVQCLRIGRRMFPAVLGF